MKAPAQHRTDRLVSMQSSTYNGFDVISGVGE